jgi:hypothetical protein
MKISARKKEVFEVIDAEQHRAVEMANELRQYSDRNQAIAIVNIRRKDPKLAALVAKMMQMSLAPGADNKQGGDVSS